MPVRELRITKRLTLVQGKTKPVCEVQAIIPEAEAEILVANFGNEPLFKRTAYANGFDDGGEMPSPGLTKMLANLVRNDACPEVLVKTLIKGQKFEANTLWDVLCFEFIAKRSFHALVVLCEGVTEFDRTLVIRTGVDDAIEAVPAARDLVAFAADTAAEAAVSELKLAV